MLNKRLSYLKGGYRKKMILSKVPLDIIYGGKIVERGRSFVNCVPPDTKNCDVDKFGLDHLQGQ